MTKVDPMRYLICAMALLAAAASCAQAAVVTLDVATRTATSDSPALEAGGVRTKDGQVGVYLLSKTTDPKQVKLKAHGLAPGEYVVRVDDEDAATRTADELANGFLIKLPGYVPDPVYERCLRSAKPKVDREYERLGLYRGGDPKRVWYTLGQAQDWIRSGLTVGETYRSAGVVIRPSGQEPSGFVWRSKLSKEQTDAALVRACKLLHMARSRMSSVINDAAVRNSAVIALTPVDFEADYSVKNGKPHVEGVVTNNCNLPISGYISYALPKGWKSSAKNLTFENLQSGKTFRVSFDLVGTSASAKAPGTLPIAANVSLHQEIDTREFGEDPRGGPFAAERGPIDFKAEMKLKVVPIRDSGVAKA